MFKKTIISIFTFLFLVIGFSFTLQAIELREAYDVEMPTEFGEAPEFEEMVEAGELPPVEERLPEDPLVVEPNDEIGEYGGTALSATMNLDGTGEDSMFFDGYMGFVRPGAFAEELYLNFPKDIEVSDEMDRFTFHLREGLKWSDGHPFTTEDIMFWYEDLLQNKEYTPAIGQVYKDATGKLMEVTAIDDYTFQVKFGTPQPYFLEEMVMQPAWNNWLMPKHYLRQFHPKYAEEEDLEKLLNEEGFDQWHELLDYKYTGTGQGRINKGAPVLGPYVIENASTDHRVWKRNPYFWKVDSEGNQLPYIKRIEADVISDREVLNGKIMSGEIDFAIRDTDIRNYPMFKKYADEGNYNVKLWTSGYASDTVYMFNQTHEDEDMREIFQDKKFRRAMSLAIDRDEINEVIYFGEGKPAQYTVLPSSKYYKEEYAKAYIEYNPEKAKEMLNEIGLVDKNGDGWRQLPNGDDFQFTLEVHLEETPKEPNVELVVAHWQDIGINVEYKTISGELQSQRAPANLLDATIWHGDKATDVRFPLGNNLIIPQAPGWDSSIWPKWGSWFTSDGEEGEEPPEHIKEIRNWWEEMMTEPDEERRIELGQKILEKQAENLWVIGTVGRSPWVVIANNNLRNLPEDMLMVWDTQRTQSQDPSQFYFKGGERAQ